MSKEDLMKLEITQEEVGYTIKLDDKRIHHVENYKIEQGTLSGSAKLILEVHVRFP